VSGPLKAARSTDSGSAGPSGTARIPPGRGARAESAADFRSHLATADVRGRRIWLYPRKPRGRYTRARRWVSAVLLLVLAVGPFVTIEGHPLLMLNVVERRFSILGRVFWPQDAAVFALGLLLFFTAIAVFTMAFGRLWCGWTCPQTVFMEMVFRPIEYWIEGDAPEQRALNASPWTARKAAKKLTKHAIFLVLSFVIGNLFLAYILGGRAWWALVTDDPRRHTTGLGFMLLFTLVFYGVFARFREQACTFICPYGRFQSVLLDEHSLVVAYDYKRGERRGRWRRDQTPAERAAAGLGDCIDCRRCVEVCPTGVDIRNGTQMECVHCTACMDACDAVMDRIGRPRGLIRYASLNGIERGERLRLTPRMLLYSAVLLALLCALGAILATRSPVDVTLLRAPGSLFQRTPEGRISNLYQLKIVNKTSAPMPVELRLEEPAGRLTVFGAPLQVPAADLLQTSVLVELEPEQIVSSSLSVRIGVYQEGKRVSTVRTAFLGPSSQAHP
jgi:cytochrome c oxidase accessory protein FixG